MKGGAGKILVGAVAAGVLTVVAAWGRPWAPPTASAAVSTSVPTAAWQSSLMDRFLTHLANRLDIDRKTLVQTVNDSLVQAVQDVRQEGQLTAEQADRLQQRIQEAQQKGRLGLGMLAHPRRWGGRGWPGVGAILQDAASLMGISVDDLVAALQKGQSLAQVAQSHGLSQDDLVNGLSHALKQRLDEAVADGRLTSQQAQQIWTSRKNQLEQLVTQTGWGLRRKPGHDHALEEGDPSREANSDPS